ncbi:MAG: thiosulfate/3-mercaptopyruvate sulfurtransferase [Solirubrobacteraceae bacterium]|nr:thiosulfate/3-mercaptopyruvate sulfurtransferase [Solirubrobacteraceae bacterium]
MLPPVVDAAWLAAHRGEVVVADVRWYLDGRSGRAAYDAGHLPGAVFVDLDACLAAPASPAAGRHPLPEPAVFARGMQAAGIGDRDAVVAYDDAGGTVAGRLVWMLRALGHGAALLDGGIGAWEGELSTGPAESAAPATGAVRFTPAPWPRERLASAGDAASSANVVLDARAGARYRGETEPVDPRAGHIPGARSLPATENLDAQGRFLEREQLRARLLAAGAGGGADVIAYCGSGVNACHTLLALEHAGLPPGRLYAGSWSQWSSDPEREAATGP